MASRGWGKNKKGVLVNSAGKTALEVRLDKYAAKLKARKEKLAAKKAEAKAQQAKTKRGYIKPERKYKSTPEEEAMADALFGKRKERTAKANTGKAETTAKAQQAKPKRGTTKREDKNREISPEEKERLDALFSKEGRAARKGKMRGADNENTKKPISTKTEDRKEGGMLESSDMGTLKNAYMDEIGIKNPKKFNEAKLNEAAELIKKAGWNYDAVVIKETGPDRYEVIGNAFVYEAAKRAGLERINTMIGNDKAEQNLKASRDDEPETLTVGPQKDRASKQYNMEESDTGTMKIIYLDEIDRKPTQRVNPKKVAEAAERMKQGKTNWEPISIRETGPDRYEIVGNAHLYEAAKQAGFEKMKTIMVGDQTKEHKLGGKGKRKR